MSGKGIAGYDCTELAQTYGTPLMITDESRTAAVAGKNEKIDPL